MDEIELLTKEKLDEINKQREKDFEKIEKRGKENPEIEKAMMEARDNVLFKARERFGKRCSTCDSLMEEAEPDYDMSEGQEADYEAGFNREFYCPKCQVMSLGDVEAFDYDDFRIATPAQLEALEKGRRTAWCNKGIKGYIGEAWYANKLRNEGYKVRKTLHYDYDEEASVFNENGVNDLIKDYSKKEELTEDIFPLNAGCPDLICLKDDEISFVEVKSNSSKVKDNQESMIEFIRAKGYNVSVVRIETSFEAKEVEDN